MEEAATKRRVVVITGASAGVGRATAQQFAREGAAIALLARGEERLEAARQEVERLGGQALAIPLDVADAAAVEAAADRIEQELGPIDVWINNAMTSVFGQVMDIEPDEYRRVTEVVYHGQVWGARAALKHMIPRDRGVIVFVGSALAYRGIPLQSAYCGGKHGVQGFFDSLRSELLHNEQHIQVCMVQLPALNTPQFDWVRSKLPNRAQPVPPIFQPEVAADAIHYASLHPRREIWVGFPSVKAIAGNKIAPGFADHYLASTGFKSQQTDQPEDPSRPDNLFTPVAGDFGAHGRFDSRAETDSPMLWASKNRRLLTLAGAGLGALAATVLASRK